jgi:putative membrane protein
MLTASALRIAERLLLVAGLALFAYLLHEVGVATVVANLSLVGWGIVPIVGQELVSYTANTLGWWAAFAPPRPAIRFRELLAARMAGDAVNYVTPTATIGGEFVRTRFLRGRARATDLVASVTIAKLTQTMAQIIFILLGLAIIIGDTPLPATARHGLFIVLVTFSAFVIGLLLLQRRGMFAPLLAVLRRLGVPQPPQLVQRLQRLDAEIVRFHDHAAGSFVASVAGFFVGWTMGVVEIYLILTFLDVPVTVHRALTIEVLSATIDGMMFFVPAKAGTQEGGKVLIFTLLGLDPAKGLALGLLRRMRELSWAAVGLFIWSRRQVALRPAVSTE